MTDGDYFKEKISARLKKMSYADISRLIAWSGFDNLIKGRFKTFT